jgi:hypothetical protein
VVRSQSAGEVPGESSTLSGVWPLSLDNLKFTKVSSQHQDNDLQKKTRGVALDSNKYLFTVSRNNVSEKKTLSNQCGMMREAAKNANEPPNEIVYPVRVQELLHSGGQSSKRVQ